VIALIKVIVIALVNKRAEDIPSSHVPHELYISIRHIKGVKAGTQKGLYIQNAK
jgi:hypothetical protein